MFLFLFYFNMFIFFFFFFQAEDGIRDADVTGVQTCALPIWWGRKLSSAQLSPVLRNAADWLATRSRVPRCVGVGRVPVRAAPCRWLLGTGRSRNTSPLTFAEPRAVVPQKAWWPVRIQEGHHQMRFVRRERVRGCSDSQIGRAH